MPQSNGNGHDRVDVQAAQTNDRKLVPDHDKGPLSEAQRESMALMAVAGLSNQYIARALNRTPQAVGRWLTQDEDIQTRVEGLQARRLRQVATHDASLMEMLDDVRAAYTDALRSGDPRLRFDAARHIESRVLPAQPQRVEGNLHIEGQIDHEVTGTLKSLSAHMVQINEAMPKLNPYLSIKSGKEALPSPGALVQVEKESLGDA